MGKYRPSLEQKPGASAGVERAMGMGDGLRHRPTLRAEGSNCGGVVSNVGAMANGSGTAGAHVQVELLLADLRRVCMLHFVASSSMRAPVAVAVGGDMRVGHG